MQHVQSLNFSLWAVSISDSIYNAIVKTFFIFGIYIFVQDYKISFLQASYFIIIPFIGHCVLSVILLPLVKKNRKLFCKFNLTSVMFSTVCLLISLFVFFFVDLYFDDEEDFFSGQFLFVLIALLLIAFSLSTRYVVLPSMIPMTLENPEHTASALALLQTLKTVAAAIFLVIFALIKDFSGHFQNTWVYAFSVFVCTCSVLLIGFMPLKSK